MLEQVATKVNLNDVLVSQFEPFPRYDNRNAWENLDAEVKSYYLDEAAKLLGKAWLTLPATYYLDFYRNGNRTKYQNMQYQRKNELFTLTIAECIEGHGRFLDDIINGVWAICEETTWVVPAHYNHNTHYETVREMPNPEDEGFVDLFAAETGSLLSWVYYFVGGKISEIAPNVTKRIVYEVDRRILQLYLKHDHFSYMGLNHDRPVNNWNPWVNSNMLTMFMILSKTGEDKLHGVQKTIKSIDRFIEFYAEDGGCDEGPSYFGAAAASLFDYLEELRAATGGAVSIFDREKIKNMAKYITRVYIADNLYVNFADAAPRLSIPAALLERIGNAAGIDDVTDFAKYLTANGYVAKQYKTDNRRFFRKLSDIFQYKAKTDAPEIKLHKTFWFSGIQVMTARDNANDRNGFFVAAKAGHNNESHNHNDVGNFILYYDSKPVVIDAGVEEYTKTTFGENRYDLWTMRSEYHNVATVNGLNQEKGREKQASCVSYEFSEGVQNNGVTEVSMELSEAYPKAALVKSYSRRITFNHGQSVVIADTYSLEQRIGDFSENLLCMEKPVVKEGFVELGGQVKLSFGDSFSVEIEEIELTDKKIINDWGRNTLYRLILTDSGTGENGCCELVFSAI